MTLNDLVCTGKLNYVLRSTSLLWYVVEFIFLIWLLVMCFFVQV